MSHCAEAVASVLGDLLLSSWSKLPSQTVSFCRSSSAKDFLADDSNRAIPLFSKVVRLVTRLIFVNGDTEEFLRLQASGV